MTTPSVATTRAVGPTRISSLDFTSRPTRNSRNITPRSARAARVALGATQASTLGPIRTPARISPTMPGSLTRSSTSASSLAVPNTANMASGIFSVPGAPASKAILH